MNEIKKVKITNPNDPLYRAICIVLDTDPEGNVLVESPAKFIYPFAKDEFEYLKEDKHS